jgi:hypothetical protein
MLTLDYSATYPTYREAYTVLRDYCMACIEAERYQPTDDEWDALDAKWQAMIVRTASGYMVTA